MNKPATLNNVTENNLRLFAAGTGVVLIAVGAVVLIAWQFDIDSLKQIVSGWPTMKANTALCFLLSGIGILSLIRMPTAIIITQSIGVFVGLIGTLTLFEYIFGSNFGIDEILFKESALSAGIGVPGRMGIITALSFCIVGFVLLTLHRRSLGVVHQFILVSGIYLMLFIVNGFLFKYETVAAISPLIMVALHTAVLYILLSISLLSFTTYTGFMALFISTTSGGLILRRLFTGTIIIPFVMELLRVLGQSAHLYSDEFGNVLLIFFIIVALSIMVTWVALIIHRLDRERGRIQKELLESREHYRILFEQAPVGMCRYNLDGTGISAVNYKLVELTGYSKDEIHSLPKEIPWVRPAEWNDLVSEAVKNTVLTDRETVVITKSGETKYCLTSIQLFPNDSYIEISWIDITERKRAEEKLIETKGELERSNKELEQFAYVASHDLQSPLQSVLGFSELLREEIGETLTPNQKEYFDRIGHGVLRLQSFIKDLLLYARAGMRKNFTEVNMSDVVEEILASLESILHHDDISVSFGPLPEIRADALQMRQLMQNLIGNAAKFRRSDTLTITIGHREHEHEWEFTVQDNGIGIEEKYFDRIFVVFQRLHSNDEYQGTGIGLALCKKIAELHKGRIWVESELHSGTTFHFTISKHLV